MKRRSEPRPRSFNVPPTKSSVEFYTLSVTRLLPLLPLLQQRKKRALRWKSSVKFHPVDCYLPARLHFSPLFFLLFDTGIQIKEDGFRVRKFYQLLFPFLFFSVSLSLSLLSISTKSSIFHWMIDDIRMFRVRTRFDSVFIQGSRMVQKWREESRKRNNRIYVEKESHTLFPIDSKYVDSSLVNRQSSF